MLTQLKQKVQSSEFALAVQEWLQGDISGQLAPYMYVEDENDGRWKNGHSAESYYVAKDEKATFNIALDELNVLVENFLDLGPGGEDLVLAKSLPIAKKTMAANYLPVDLSPAMAVAATKTVERISHIKTKPIVADFFEKLPTTKPNALISLLGLTFGNIETYGDVNLLRQRVIQILTNYRQAVTGSSFFLVSFDANTNEKEIVSCYDNEEFGGLIRSCLDQAIDTSDFDYHVRWTPENYQLATGLRSKRDQMVDCDGERFAVEEGEFLPVLNSYRFPVSFVVDAAANAGWTHLKSWSATGRVHYVLFKAA